MIPKEKRVKQEFDMLVFLDALVEKTKKIMNGAYSDKSNPDKIHEYFGKKDLWMRQEIGINLFQLSENISAANGIRVQNEIDYNTRRSFQEQALGSLNKLRDAIKLSAFFISRISDASINEWVQKKIVLEKSLEGWMESDYKRYKHLLK